MENYIQNLSELINFPEVSEQKSPELPKQMHHELSDDANIEEISNFISRRREPVNYRKLWDENTPVLFIGERHSSLSVKNELIENLPDFRESGMTHLAIEMLREEYQDFIDAYIKNGIYREEILEIFRKGWDWEPGMPEKYMEIIDTAKSLGVQILAIDLYTISSEYTTPDYFRKRNANWARIATHTLEKDEKARILFYCGEGHSGYNLVGDSANEILEVSRPMDLKPTVIEYAGGKVFQRNPSFFDEKVTWAAQEIGLGGEKFVLRINHNDPVRGSDYIIHLPQTETKKE